MLGARARLIVAVAAGLLVTLTPFVNDVCARSCERPVEASCPQHAPRPESRCAHDHRVMTADLPRTHHASGPQIAQPATLVAAFLPSNVTVTCCTASTPLQQSPPGTARALLALRI
jgi:hypothetical protein